MENIKDQIQYWINYDYNKSGDEYRKTHDLDCILTDGNLYADTLFSLWLPLRYVLNYCGTKEWKKYRKIKYPKKDKVFLHALMNDLQTFIPDKKMLEKLGTLFGLGRTRANVIILPYRWWNRVRGGKPYFDYFPHFLYDILNTEDVKFLEATQEWIERENLQMFFDGEIKKDNILDLCGTGNPCSHNPRNHQFDVNKLIDNYIDILKQRKRVERNGSISIQENSDREDKL